MAGLSNNLDDEQEVEQARQRVMRMGNAQAGRAIAPQPPMGDEDTEVADARARVMKLMGTQSPSTGLPLRTEREANSPMLQRQESLSASDPFAMDLPERQSSRMPIGSTVGGITGAIAGAPSGPVGAVGLSGLLSAGGDALQQLVEHLMGSPHAPKTSMDAGKQMLEESAWGMAGELGGRVVGGVANKVFRRAAVSEAQAAHDFVTTGMMFNGKPMVPKGTPFSKLFMTPAEMTGGKNYIQTLQNMAEGSFFGKSTLEEFKANRDKFLANSMERFTQQIGKDMRPGDLGELIANEVKGNYQAARAPARSLYQFLTLMTTPKKVPTYGMKPTGILNRDGTPHMVRVQTGEAYDTRSGAWVSMKGIKRSLEKDSEIANVLRGLAAKEGGDDVVKTIMSYPDKVPFFVAQNMRTRLQSLADVFSIENKKAPALGILKKTASMVDGEIANGLKAYSQDAHDIWRYANDLYRGANEQFNNRFLREILNKTDRRDLPEVVMESLLKPQKYSDLLKVKHAVGPDTWSTVQRSGLQRILELSSKDSVIQPHLLEQHLFGPHGLGPDKMNVLFSSEQQQWIKKFIHAAHQTMKQGDTTGKMAIQLAQPAAIVGAATGNYTGTSISVLLAPPGLAQIMTSPRLSKLFVKGMTTPASSPSAGAIIGRLLSTVAPRSQERSEPSRGSERHLPSTQDAYQGLNLP